MYSGDVKGEFRGVVVSHSGRYSEIIGKKFGYDVAVQIAAFLVTICGLIT